MTSAHSRQNPFTAPSKRRWLGAVAVTAAATIVATLGIAVTTATPAAAAVPTTVSPIAERSDDVVTADPLPTVQIDEGIVWTQAVAGDIVFAGGSFSNARPAGALKGEDLMPRDNLLSFDINTGVATDFAPEINGTVKSLAVSPDGETLYVGGSFTEVEGEARGNIAAFDIATGDLLSFAPKVGGSFVNAIAVTEDAVYVGGSISNVNNRTRTNLAAVSTTGELLGWAPTTDHQVDAMILAPEGDKLVVAGRFASVNDVDQFGTTALDLEDGSVLPFAVSTIVRNGEGTGKAGIWSLATDDTNVYGAAWAYYPEDYTGELEGVFAADGDTGDLVWQSACKGDTYGVYSDGTTVYAASHTHNCEPMGGFPEKSPDNMRNAVAFTVEATGTQKTKTDSWFKYWNGTPTPSLVNWFPQWYSGTASGMGQAGWSIVGNGEYVVYGGEFVGLNGQTQQGLVRFASTPETGEKQRPRLSGDTWVPEATSGGPGSVRVTIGQNWDRDDRDLTYELRVSGSSTPLETTEPIESEYWKADTTLTFVPRDLTPGEEYTFTVVATDAAGNTAKSKAVTATAGDAAESAYADRIIADGADLYWRLGDDGDGAVDTVDWAGANDAAWNGAPTVSDDSAVTEEAASSVALDGESWAASDTKATISETSSTEIWVKTDSTTGGRLLTYGLSATGSSSAQDRVVYMTDNGQIRYAVKAPGVVSIVSSESYNDDEWHHVVAQVGPDGAELYVDGERVAHDADVTSATASSKGYWRVGGDTRSTFPGTSTSGYLTGSLDEFAVYAEPLTAAQIASHYAAGSGEGLPTADIQVDGADLSWSVDGSGSSAVGDRTIESYEWDFGDGATAEGATAAHDYDAAGTYTVTLTVTDSLGVTSKTSTTVDATVASLAEDDFDRTVASGWGTAASGQAWTTSSTGFSVDAGAGLLSVKKGATLNATLDDLSATDVEVTATVSFDRVPDASMHTTIAARRTSAGEYKLTLRSTDAGAVTLYLARDVDGTETVLATKPLADYTLTEDASLKVRFEVATDGDDTVLSASVWPTESDEPDEWTVSATDTSTALSEPGSVGVSAYLSSKATNGPVVLSVDDLLVEPAAAQ